MTGTNPHPTSPVPATEPGRAGEPVDVVVVGAGLAGYGAAIEAAEAGARVLMMEKESDPGGSSLMSGGSFAFAGTELQAELGIQDSPEQLYRELMGSRRLDDDDTLVRTFVDHQLDAYHWLGKLGVPYTGVSHSGDQSVPRSHGVAMKSTFATIQSYAQGLPNLAVRTARPVTAVNATDGRVRGVSYTPGARPEDAPDQPASAVVLTTGGFSRGERLIRMFAPRLAAARRMGGLGNTGDGIVMAMALGADLSDIGEIKATFGVSAELDDMPAEPTLLNSLYRGGIIVNTAARRFIDESISYKLISEHCLAQPQGLGIQIFDEKVMEQTLPGKLVNDYRGARDNGYLISAASIGELADGVGLDPAVLGQTIARYNDAARVGEDPDFGRTHLSADYGDLPQIDRAPFYAYRSTAGVTSTYGGLKVDATMAVRHVLGGTIPGLYAAGELVGGLHGYSYMSGSALSKALIFGRIAGHAAAGTRS